MLVLPRIDEEKYTSECKDVGSILPYHLDAAYTSKLSFDRDSFGVAYLQDELTDGKLEDWFHAGQNHSMIQQRHRFYETGQLAYPAIYARLKSRIDQIIYTLKIKQSYILERQPVLDDSIDIEYPASPGSNQSNIRVTEERLLKLLQEEEDEDGLLKPTPYAFDKTWNLLKGASKSMKEKFPKAWVTTDGKGGIRLTWSNPDAKTEIRLICGATLENQTYIYHEQGNEYDVVEYVSASSLSYWLTWFNQA
jgi:hypothetical protein